ncbi:dolichyl-P-Man:Man(5)GlcNAc(2)-PP-dolichol alpha-1,3-mannosyltransferase [Knufia obscura]|uniref:Dol-P-Man:Man(5)GlcNAc(2)-PP-Dol alpha-1,3-mannosyltransferase n=1 Tax=Knufia obscura TaxID=1635080 RepID=A0ABR0S4B4_9EURO|nr:dolichyl-P-Man:Man(5)GlcNAc(2)-PP-dolichol alpha-1,3-mannosyltransferase [Knufia obscura]
MIQVAKFLPPSYETNYNKLTGPTGPCVYPAFHVYIHSALYYVTDKGEDIKLAQVIYAGLYLCTLALVLASYRRAGAPPWLLVPLILSKRLHSIFLLRLFNDCWATFFFWLAVYGATRKRWSIMVLAWTLALNVKMTMLLPLPALGAILVQGAGTERAVFWGVVSAITTMGSAAPFMGTEEAPIYFRQAFDLGRQFMYKWTVNWMFIPEEAFLSKQFAYTFLAAHASILLAFLHYKWVRPSSGGLPHFVRKYLNYTAIEAVEQDKGSKRMTPQFVMDALLGSIVIGMMCARSLHYQFYSYLGWATPYIMWRSGAHLVRVVGACALQELAWLIYPQTEWGSISVVLLLALQVASSWQSMPTSYDPVALAKEEKKLQ